METLEIKPNHQVRDNQYYQLQRIQGESSEKLRKNQEKGYRRMTAESTSASVNTVGARAAVVRNLKTLSAPEEGGTKKEYEDFLEKIQSHVTIGWDFGKDIGHL